MTVTAAPLPGQDQRIPGTVTIELTLARHLIPVYWKIYDTAWEGMRNKSPCRQYLRRHEFRAEALDPKVLKFVLWGDNGLPAAIAFVAIDLAVVPWVAPEYFAELFPEHYAEQRIFYVGSFVTHPSARGTEAAKLLLIAISDHMGETRGIAAFDCSEYMRQAKWPGMIARIGHTRVVLDARDLEQPQHYYAYVVDGPLPGLAA